MSRVRQRIWLPASSWLIAGTSQSQLSVSRASLTASWNALRRCLCSLYSSLPNPESSPDAVVSGSQRMNGKIPLRNPLRILRPRRSIDLPPSLESIDRAPDVGRNPPPRLQGRSALIGIVDLDPRTLTCPWP